MSNPQGISAADATALFQTLTKNVEQVPGKMKMGQIIKNSKTEAMSSLGLSKESKETEVIQKLVNTFKEHRTAITEAGADRAFIEALHNWEGLKHMDTTTRATVALAHQEISLKNINPEKTLSITDKFTIWANEAFRSMKKVIMGQPFSKRTTMLNDLAKAEKKLVGLTVLSQRDKILLKGAKITFEKADKTSTKKDVLEGVASQETSHGGELTEELSETVTSPRERFFNDAPTAQILFNLQQHAVLKEHVHKLIAELLPALEADTVDVEGTGAPVPTENVTVDAPPVDSSVEAGESFVAVPLDNPTEGAEGDVGGVIPEPTPGEKAKASIASIITDITRGKGSDNVSVVRARAFLEALAPPLKNQEFIAGLKEGSPGGSHNKLIDAAIRELAAAAKE